MPKVIKGMDNERMLYTIMETKLLTSEEKTYSGIPTVNIYAGYKTLSRFYEEKL